MKRLQIIALLLLATAVMESYQILGLHRHKETDVACQAMQDRCLMKSESTRHKCRKIRKTSTVCHHNRVGAIPCMNTCLSTCDIQQNVFPWARCILSCEKACPTRLNTDYSNLDREDFTSNREVRRTSWLENRHHKSSGSRARSEIIPEAREVCQSYVSDCLAVVDRQKDLRNVERDTQKVNCKRIGGRARECLKDVQDNVRCFDTCRSNCHDANSFNDWNICLETCSEPCFRHDRNPDMYQKLPLDMVSSFVIARCYLKADKASQVERCHDLERRENDLKDAVNPYQNCLDGCINNYVNGETTIEYCLAGCPSVIEREREEDPKHRRHH